jgi:hypothetical protein
VLSSLNCRRNPIVSPFVIQRFAGGEPAFLLREQERDRELALGSAYFGLAEGDGRANGSGEQLVIVGKASLRKRLEDSMPPRSL